MRRKIKMDYLMLLLQKCNTRAGGYPWFLFNYYCNCVLESLMAITWHVDHKPSTNWTKLRTKSVCNEKVSILFRISLHTAVSYRVLPEVRDREFSNTLLIHVKSKCHNTRNSRANNSVQLCNTDPNDKQCLL